jgi:hypothetical protein
MGGPHTKDTVIDLRGAHREGARDADEGMHSRQRQQVTVIAPMCYPIRAGRGAGGDSPSHGGEGLRA